MKTSSLHLSANLGTSRRFVCFDIGIIRKLARQENAGMTGRKLLRHSDTSKETALLFADRNDVSAVASNQIPALMAHPIGHENGYRMAQHGADGGKGYTRIPARGFRDHTAGMYFPLFVGLLEDVQRHAVLDAARHVQLFGLGVD